MAEHPNATQIRRVYAAFAAGEMGEVLERFDPDVVMYVGGAGPLAGVQKGRDGVTAVVTHSMELTGGTQRLDVQQVFADDDHAVVHVRETATRAADRAILDVHEVHLLTLGPDGRIKEFWDIPADAGVHDAFFDGH
jgi:ketosteroid isomerase-like protein